MIRRAVIASAVAAALATPAYAQTKFEVSFTGGYTTSEGIKSNSSVTAPAGTFNEIKVKSGGSFGLSFAGVLENGGEIGFKWGRQMSKLGVAGTTSIDIGDMNIDHYHAYFAYNFLPEAKARPYVSIGFGATDYGSVAYSRPTKSGTIDGPVRFSTTWGAGVKAFASNGKVGFRAGIEWTPTYITSEATGYWCDPYWGCYLTGDSKFSNQFEFNGGIVFRFGGQ